MDKRVEGKFWSDKVMDLANLSAIALIIGPLVADRVYWLAMIFGVILYASLVILTFYIRRRR